MAYRVAGRWPAALGCWVAALAMGTPHTAWAGEGDVLLEIHFSPVPNTQIAIWLEDEHGAFIDTAFVTQATGRLGIGNRPGRWDFLSSWRFPYGARPQVLPVWAHRRGKRYPRLVFHDDDATDQDSLGWHENSSSPEPYFCRPLAAEEHETISTDTMTCPSPLVFQTDKGKFSDDDSMYPPRGDLTEYEPGHDHDDVRDFTVLNDLDSVSGATPSGTMPELVTVLVPEARATGMVTAYIEVNLEHDENPEWDFAREADHYVDPRLSSYGVEYLGQPSVVYRVEIDPSKAGFEGTDAYAGYGDERGEDGTIVPPDNSISQSDGSGADRLQLYTLNDETFRFGVYSHGPGGAPKDPEDSGWSGCAQRSLPAMSGIELEPLEFDTVRVHFTVPPMPEGTSLRNVRMYYRTGHMALTDDNASSAVQAVPMLEDCSGGLEPGDSMWCDLRGLFGNQGYQVGIRIEDACNNASTIVAGDVATPQQEFAQVDGFCFVATAAYGANWTDRVRALRIVRDVFFKPFPMGMVFVQFYYANSPPVAAAIAKFELGRLMARLTLGPLTEVARGLVATLADPERD